MPAFTPTTPEATSALDDLVLGTELSETIDGQAGDDLILGDGGDDTITGGDGADILLGEAGNDFLIGDDGNDTMIGGDGDDHMLWDNGDGSDVMEGGAGFDTAEATLADGGDDLFAIGLGAAGRIEAQRLNLGQFALDIGSTERLIVRGLAGDDTISGSAGLAGEVELRLFGGLGNDELTGGDGADFLHGGNQNDLLVGGRGDDTMVGGSGNDRMVWNNGDGSDVMEGGAGRDIAEINGADGAGDAFEIAAADGNVAFARTNLGPFTLDISETELMILRGQGGDDTMTGGAGLAGLIELRMFGGTGNDEITGGDGADLLNGGNGDDELVGGRGNDTMIGGSGNDEMEWNNGDGSDVMIGGTGHDTAEVYGATNAGDAFVISADGDDVLFARTNLGQFTLEISETEVLEVNGLSGDDTITGSEGLAGLIDLRLFGGAGNDEITGGDGADLLHGGNGDDELVGFRGNDTMIGGAGDDEMEWNNGDGSDVMIGGEGHDTAEVYGADGAGDIFEVTANGDDIHFARTNLGLFTLEISETEVLEVNGEGGDDRITASGSFAQWLQMEFSGGDGNDTMTGGNTDDHLSGDAGNDVLDGGAGDDVLVGGTGADVFLFASGDDRIEDFEFGIDQALVAAPAGFDIEGHLSQVGADVVLTLEDGTLTFADTTLAQFEDGNAIGLLA